MTEKEKDFSGCWSTEDFLWGYGGFLLLASIGCLMVALGSPKTTYFAGYFFGAATMQSFARSAAEQRGWRITKYPPKAKANEATK